MAYVITGRCLGERYGACVDVCPVEAMRVGEHEAEPMMVIDPAECICCGSCLPECPIEAIVDDEASSSEWAEFNRAAAAMWPSAHTERGAWMLRDPSEPPQRQA